MSGNVTGSAPAGRSAAFLEEIGVGPLWRLRRSAMPQDGGDSVEEGAGLRPAAAFIAAPQEHAPVVPDAVLAEPSDAMPPSAPRDAKPAPRADASSPRAESRAWPDAVVEAVPSPSPVARVTPAGDDATAPPVSRAATDDDSTTRFDEFATSAPRAATDDDSTVRFDESSTSTPRVAPTDDDSTARFDESSTSTPRVAPTDDDSTAWFDDAPAPPAPVPVSAEAIARMDWDELKTTAAKCTRCALSRTRRAVVFGRGDARATLMVLASAPGRADEREGVAIGGEAGVLLENMLRAAGFAGAGANNDYYVSHLVKCRPSGGEGAERAPAPEELAACRPYLERELALTGARTIVTLGHPALRGLLGAGVPAARGAVQHIDADARSVAVVATYHPADLLRQGENKAGAWADLVLARETHGAGPA